MSYNIAHGQNQGPPSDHIGRKPQLQDKATGEYRREQDIFNRVLWNPMKVNLTRADALQKAITGRYEALGAKERKNSVLAQEFIISASPEFFDGLSDEKSRSGPNIS